MAANEMELSFGMGTVAGALLMAQGNGTRRVRWAREDKMAREMMTRGVSGSCALESMLNN